MKVQAFNEDVTDYIELSAVISREETYVKHSVYRVQIIVDTLGIPDSKIDDADQVIENSVKDFCESLKVGLKDKSDFDSDLEI